jgi:hypothetical protein
LNSSGIRIAASVVGNSKQLSPDFTVQLISYNILERTYTWSGSRGNRPANVETPAKCSSQFQEVYSDADLFSQIKGSAGWRAYVQDRERFEVQIQAANAERLRIGAYSSAFAATADARNAAEQWLQRLGA